MQLIERAMREKQEAKANRDKMSLDPQNPRMISDTNNVLNTVKLGIDFIKLAELALKHKPELSGFLVMYEK